jgi:hypothetical protein
MGSVIGGLITRKKRKKIARQMTNEYTLQAEVAKEAQRIGQLQANFGAQQEKIQQLREARIRRAAVIASGVNAGVGVGSTAVQGGTSSAYSAALGNVSAVNAMQTYSEAISQQQEKLAESEGRLKVLGVKMDTQQQKASMIGSIVDTGISLATLPWGGAGGSAAGIGGVVQNIFTNK